MATQKVTISVDERLLADFRQQATDAGMLLSPYLVRAARNWMLYEDARRLAAREHELGRDTPEYAEAEYALQREAETAAEHGHGHAA